MLQRAKFTRAQIATQQLKFYNLFRIAPMTTMEVAELRKLREQNDELLAALQSMPHPEYRSGISHLTSEWLEWRENVARPAIIRAGGAA